VGAVVLIVCCVGPTPLQETAARPWWKSAVIYEIYTRSFSDSNGDGVGDLNGITQKLDYLAALGVDALWLTPFYASPNRDFGYDIADYRAVSAEHGTLADFDRLVREAGRRELRVLVDLVLNHTSDRHRWFAESRSSRSALKRDWYIWRDGKDGGPPNNWQSIFGGSAWELDPQTGQYYYHFFFKEQPDLNWRNPEVRAALADVMRFWLDRGVAGFRLDVPDTLLEDPALTDNPIREGVNWVGDPNMEHLHNMGLTEVHEIMRELRALVDVYPGTILLGETSSPKDAHDLIRWYGENDDELHLAMNFFFTGVRELSVAGFVPPIEQAERHAEQAWPVFLLSNHDRPRQMSRFGDGNHDREIGKMLAALILTLPGTPILYYGEELGMVSSDPKSLDAVKDPVGKLFWPQFKGRDGTRTPMQWDSSENAGFSTGIPWLPVPSSASTFNVATESGDSDSILNFYKNLLGLRRASSALRDGDWRRLEGSGDDVLSYLRVGSEETVWVALNLGDSYRSLSLNAACFGSKGTNIGPLLSSHQSRDEFASAEMRLAPYETFIARIGSERTTAGKRDLLDGCSH
jgi:alpha-glucosidase